MTQSIVSTALFIAGAALGSAILFPPGDVPKQVMAASLWFVSGFLVCKVWT